MPKTVLVMGKTIRRILAELLATFLFVFAIIASLNTGAEVALPLGFTLMVLVYATGAHLWWPPQSSRLAGSLPPRRSDR